MLCLVVGSIPNTENLPLLMLNETNVSILYLSNYDIIAYYYNIKYITSYVILFIIDWCDAYDIIVQTNGTIDITCSIIGIMSLLYDIIILSLFYDFIWGNYDISGYQIARCISFL